MKIHELEGMHPRRRRRFLKWMAAALTGATISEDLRLACLEVAGGKAYAQGIASSRPTYFIELNLRDQWDNGHVFVAPSLVPKLDQFQKGASNELTAIFLGQADVKASAAHRAYLSPQSSALEPHLDHIAMIDACNPSMGVIHGHEAANPIRSPGRAYQATGRSPMWNNDPVSTTNLQGCEPFYSTTPTPASLHNHYQHTLTTGLRNGIAFKGISRSIHTAYHFG
ncbi:MAG: hypothetical protein KC417_00420, partial [Myxococcales bacterium]|nr:hypothetical protein [Myxococcales bacterium]